MEIRIPLLRSFALVAVCILAAAAWIVARAGGPADVRKEQETGGRVPAARVLVPLD